MVNDQDENLDEKQPEAPEETVSYLIFMVMVVSVVQVQLAMWRAFLFMISLR